MSKFRVNLKEGDRVLTEGVIDKNARHVFTHGACQNLAVALHERTGWPIIEIDHDEAIDGFVEMEMTEAQVRKLVGRSRNYHTGVVTPEGLVLDIEGLHEQEAWLERWSVAPGAKVSVSYSVPIDAEPDWYQADMDRCRARSFVDPLLASIEFERDRRRRKGDADWPTGASAGSPYLPGARLITRLNPT